MADTLPKPTVQTLSSRTADKIYAAFDTVLQTGNCEKYDSRSGLSLNYEKRIKIIKGVMDPVIRVSGEVYGPDCPVTTTTDPGISRRSTYSKLTVTNTNIPKATQIITKDIIEPIILSFIPKNSQLSKSNFNNLNFHVVCRDKLTINHKVEWHIDAHNLGMGSPLYQIIYYVDTPTYRNGQTATVANRGSLAFILTHGTPDPGNRRVTSLDNIPAIGGFLTPTKGIGIGFEPHSSWHKVLPPGKPVELSRKIIVVSVYNPSVPYMGMRYTSGALGTNVERRMNAYANSVQKTYNALNNNRKKIFLTRISSKPFIQNVPTYNTNGVDLINALSSSQAANKRRQNAENRGEVINLT